MQLAFTSSAIFLFVGSNERSSAFCGNLHDLTLAYCSSSFANVLLYSNNNWSVLEYYSGIVDNIACSTVGSSSSATGQHQQLVGAGTLKWHILQWLWRQPLSFFFCNDLAGSKLACRVGGAFKPLSRIPPAPFWALSAQISATTKRGCRPWAGSLSGTRKQGSTPFASPPPLPQQKRDQMGD